MIDQQDQDVYDELGSAFADVRFEREAADVIRRGRTLRRRRRAMPAAAAVGVLAASLSLAAVTQQHSPASTPGGALVNVDEAAFSVHTDAKTGLVSVDIHALVDESELKQVLAEAGVPVFFQETPNTSGGHVDKHATNSNGYCSWAGASVSSAPNVLVWDTAKGDTAFEINRSAMPHGSVIGIDYIIGPGTFHGKPVAAVSTTVLSGMPTGCF